MDEYYRNFENEKVQLVRTRDSQFSFSVMFIVSIKHNKDILLYGTL